MNSINIVARMTRDPEKRETSSDQTVCLLRAAIPRRKKQGEDQGAVFVDVTVFGRQADSCLEYLEKGRQVAVSGRLEYSEWEAEDGSKRSKHEVIADNVEFLGAPGQGTAGLAPDDLSSIEEVPVEF